jgi:hypothetical protein
MLRSPLLRVACVAARTQGSTTVRTLFASAPLFGKPPHQRDFEEMEKRWPLGSAKKSFVMAERWRKRHLGAPEVRAHDHAEYTASLAVKAALATQARAHIQEVLLTHYPARVPIADLGALLKWPETYKKHLKGLRRFVPAHAHLFGT